SQVAANHASRVRLLLILNLVKNAFFNLWSQVFCWLPAEHAKKTLLLQRLWSMASPGRGQ
ncbi:hypothetical protein OAZ24_02560, partial [Synechococcus sp. AH-736-G21]|nr:hypothetical protein [Synechococcus sp. AH-736-G21]